MRQAIGSTWLMQLVIIFMLIFVAFLALTINFTKAFKIKNELVTIIEKNEGLSEGTNGTIYFINNYLSNNGYMTKGYCAEDEFGKNSLSLDDTSLPVQADEDEKYFYCIKKTSYSTSAFPNRAKYTIRIFFHFSLPVIGDLFTFSSEGTTIDINYPLDDIHEFIG